MPDTDLNPDDVKITVRENNNSHAEIPSNFGVDLGKDSEKLVEDGSAGALTNEEGLEDNKENIHDNLDGEEDDEYEYVEADEGHGFVHKIDNLMQELNLSRRHFVIFSGCFSLLIIGIILSFVLLFKFFGQETKDIIAPINVVSVHEDDSEGFVSKFFNFDFLTKQDSDLENNAEQENSSSIDTKDDGKVDASSEKEGFFTKWFSFGKEDNSVADVESDAEQDKSDSVPSDDAEESVEEEVGFFKSLFILGDDKTKVDKDEIVVNEEGAGDVDDSETTKLKTSITVSSQSGDMSLLSAKSFGITVTNYYGRSTINAEKLSYYIRTYRKLKNVFNIDLFNYLNNFSNRGEGFNEFLATFKGVNEQAKLAYEDLRQEIELYSNRFEKINARVNTLEAEFFESLDTLASEDSPGLLESYQELSSQRIVLKSELAARKAVAEKYEKALPVVEKKIEAIEVNQDPFVKGVRVVEFQQVDLDLVLQGS